MRKICLLGWLLFLTGMVAAQETLNNDSIIQLSKAGFSEDMIVSTINSSPGNFDTSVDGLIALKDAGVSEKVLAAIMSKSTRGSTAPTASSTASASGSAFPTYYDTGEVQDSQHFGIGFKYLGGDGLHLVGFNARFWTESKLGFEVGWGTYSEDLYYVVSARANVIPVSVLYTLSHVETDSMYIRPYIGGGINFTSVSASAYGYSDSKSKIGGQGFGGAEFTFNSLPRLSFGGDIGFYRLYQSNKARVGFQVHYYLK